MRRRRPKLRWTEVAVDEAVVEEGFESGETGSLEAGDSASDDEAVANQ